MSPSLSRTTRSDQNCVSCGRLIEFIPLKVVYSWLMTLGQILSILIWEASSVVTLKLFLGYKPSFLGVWFWFITKACSKSDNFILSKFSFCDFVSLFSSFLRFTVFVDHMLSQYDAFKLVCTKQCFSCKTKMQLSTRRVKLLKVSIITHSYQLFLTLSIKTWWSIYNTNSNNDCVVTKSWICVGCTYQCKYNCMLYEIKLRNMLCNSAQQIRHKP
jgi:hypothetical protein